MPARHAHGSRATPPASPRDRKKAPRKRGFPGDAIAVAYSFTFAAQTIILPPCLPVIRPLSTIFSLYASMHAW